MKTVIVLGLCLTGALAWLSDEQKAELNKYREICTKETGVTLELLGKALIGETTNEEEKLRCFSACMLKQTKVMNEDGTISVDVIRENAPSDMPKQQVEDIVDKCKDTPGANDCDKAAEFVKCVIERVTAK